MAEERSFGPNEWLIEEMYERYLENPDSVGERWKEFFEDYEGPQDGKGPAPPQRRSQEKAPTIKAKPTDKPAVAEPRAKIKAAEEKLEAGPEAEKEGEASLELLRGAEAVIVKRMEESIGVPTATSVRTVPAKLLEVNRNILNNHLKRRRGGKLSFTHLIGYAVVQALEYHPGMNVSYQEADGKPHAVHHSHVNLGLAVDMKRKDGTRTLIVPNIKNADTLDFGSFFSAYEELIKKVNNSKLTPDDFDSTTVTITNPGMIGTVQSVPRLMSGQAAIIGVGALGYPAEYRGADPDMLARIGVGKVITLTSTYDHRVIQGALSGEFLGRVEELLLGEGEFYDQVFESVDVPYVPVRWRQDLNPVHESIEAEEKQARVFQLLNQYRVRGHLIADLDPLEAKPPEMHPELDPAYYGLTIWDLDRPFLTGGLANKPKLKLSEILGIMRDAYCRTHSPEYMHISDPVEKRWIQHRVEGVDTSLPIEDQKRILDKLNEAEAFETFLHRKYVGHKRFSLQGGESLIPMLDAILDSASRSGVKETVLGMSHRGRLNVLTSIVGKSYSDIFKEFEGKLDPQSAQGSGDVKYHLGATGTFEGSNGKSIRVTLASNPSHLESVNPVVEGIARARQDSLEDGRRAVLPILLHGDAAFAGQGVVAETLNLSQLAGYRTGGTIHIIVNNQVGFTTGSDYGRSSTYATDVAKMVQAPIFHVNGDDPEACIRMAWLAFEFREAFHKDVVIDMWCYRKWGHNEADDPSFTQPIMYRAIENRRSVRKRYTETLVNRGDLTLEEAEQALEDFRTKLEEAFEATKEPSRPGKAGSFLEPVGLLKPLETGVPRPTLDRVIKALTTTPEGFDAHPKLAKALQERSQALDKDEIDWALGEALAMGSLLLDAVTVRLSGQDTRRGTFNQRHSALVDQSTGEEYTLLQHLDGNQAPFYVYDSLLSEFAALGFEYGYSVGDPEALVMWEAQFGDFVNGAQIIIDQFIVAGEDKWAQTSALVMLLPHGFEGQGPEHSSARLERFLTLAAKDNIRVAAPTTPAQFFHLLRRQAFQREVRRPLVVMTPKSFLRLPAARSGTDEFIQGHFQWVLPDPDPPDDPRRVLFCSGKFFYDLLGHRKEQGIDDVAIVRVEQLYPFPEEPLRAALDPYQDAEIFWVQEEPENMGAWRFIAEKFERALGIKPRGVHRPESASPATGSFTAHQWEQQRLSEEAFARIPTAASKQAG